MDEAEKRFYAAHHIINHKNIFRNIEFFLNRFAVSQMAHLCRVTVDKDPPDQYGVIKQEKLSIQSPGSTFEIIVRGLQFRLVAGGDYWVGDLDLTFDGSTVLKASVLKERENLTARYVPPYRLRNDIHQFDAYDWIDRLDELVKRMLLLERDRDSVRTLSSIKAQAENIDLSKYPIDTAFTPVDDGSTGDDPEWADPGNIEEMSAENGQTPATDSGDDLDPEPVDAVVAASRANDKEAVGAGHDGGLDRENMGPVLGESPEGH